ncbi:glycosyltransferase [Oceanicola sp. S124]|uniref:glycosyltransferase n=1 Tax=Oceanicola sp. S124 TaxID=1042378 RepID=UPI0002559A33|nr:glycosyltransferase [Oceanicola sp. S124]
MSHIQMLGLCRFSYPTGGDGFEGAGGGLAANVARLYDPARLARRFWFFEEICLPTLAAQSDPDFTLLLLHGEALPEPWLSRLQRAIAPLPQIRALALPEGRPHAETCREAMRAARDPEARVVGEFTLDDDDGLAPDFIAEARAQFAPLRPLWKLRKRAALDFNGGMVVQAGAGGIALTPVQADFWAPGLVVFFAPRSTRSIQDYNHRRLWSRMPALTLPEPVMFLRGSHDSNDSRLERRLPGLQRGGAEAESPDALLQSRFGLDAAALRRSWATLIGS